MERRRALTLISAAAAGALILPSCNLEKIPKLNNLEIDKNGYKLIKGLSQKIVPIPEEMVLENLPPHDFLLSMIDDCNSREDIEKFSSGLNAFLEYMKTAPKLEDMEDEQMESIMMGTAEIPNLGKLTDFTKTVKNYNVQYYTSLEEYLSNYTDWEFGPGRFKGCVKI